MATIVKRGTKWQAQVRLAGTRPVYRTFTLKRDAQAWAKATEVEIERDLHCGGQSMLRRLTVSDLITRYRQTVRPHKKGQANEAIVLTALQRQSFCKLKISDFKSHHVSAYRDKRAIEVKATTINRELTLLKHVLDVARNEWSIPIQDNPAASVRRLKADLPRTRRLQSGELDKLLLASNKSRNALLRPLLEFALATAMRRGEILSIQWHHLDRDNRTLSILETKTGHPRVIPLSEHAFGILCELKSNEPGPFPLTPNAVRIAWRRLTKRAGIENLNFHDLRHEAISRFFEMGLSIPEVALISGHRDYRMLARYTHLRPVDVRNKIDQAVTIAL